LSATTKKIEVHKAKTCFGLGSNTIQNFVLRSSEVYDKLQEKKVYNHLKRYSSIEY
jgi:hypothetical protein